MKLLIIANCQYQGLLEYFKLVVGRHNIDFVPLNIINNAVEFNRYSEYAQRNISSYDIILTFPINHERFGFWRTENIKTLYPEKTFVIDNLYFAGLHPDAVCVGDIFNRLKSPLEIYHSKIILHSFINGLSEEECLKRFNYDEYEKLGYFDVYETSSKELLARNVHCDIKFAEEFLDLIKKEHSLFIFNHPTSYIFYHFGRKISSHLGIKTEDFPHQLLINPLSDHIWWGVYPEISDYHKLMYKMPLFFKKMDRDGGQILSLNDFIHESYEMYRQYGKEKLLQIPEVVQLLETMNKTQTVEKTDVDKVITEMYKGFFDRLPDKEGYSYYKQKLLNKEISISDMIKAFVKSEEFKNKKPLSDDVINQVFLGLLKRLPEQEAFFSIKREIENGKPLSQVINAIVNSQEFFMKYHDKSNHITYDTQISYAYDRPAVAFIHIPKTAGSSLHYLFKEKFGAEKVSPLFNDLHLLPISFTYLYDVIFGHMDYEIAKLTIQRKDVKLITFLRDPIKRLISVYRFWWSHDPELHKGNFAVELANKYSPEEFFNTEEVKDSLWNEMFAKFMGCKFRDTVKRTLSLLNERSKQIYIETVLKPLIHERIKDYFYIGMQDNFSQDVIEMFNKLEIPCTKEDIEKARVNITDENIGKHGFKNIKPDFQITDKVISSISELTELDMLLYEEVKKFKEKQNSTETVEKIIFDDFMKKNSEIVIDALYKSILNRKPDSEGLRHYSDVIKNSNGDGLWMVISALINSQEFKEKQNLLH